MSSAKKLAGCAQHADDWKLGIHYTGGRDSNDEPLGTIALIVPPKGAITMWRFGDLPNKDVDFEKARRFSQK